MTSYHRVRVGFGVVPDTSIIIGNINTHVSAILSVLRSTSHGQSISRPNEVADTTGKEY